MSFSDKVASLMARPGQDPNAKDDVPWYLRYAGRGVGTVGGIIAIILGLVETLSLITMNISCLIGGILQVLAGFTLICFEAPCCCMFLDYVQNVSEWIDNRPYWNKAIIYVCISIPPVIFCTGLSSIFGGGLIFLTGVIYGMMALGKKATVEEMRANAQAGDQRGVPNANPPTSNTTSTNMRSNLVNNAQPMSFTGPPMFDSNV
ncbi:calcium channel flower isoform X1 [Onthophagus taurus]|uniref:calcium channel flower isoform X1 n=1 Tax=Onthophagus taurus TaxID=166361 RepID=UPI0039BE5C68